MDWIGSRSPEQSNLTPQWTSDSSLEPAKMRLGYFSNEFPHDDLKDLLRRLRNHSKDVRYTILDQTTLRNGPLGGAVDGMLLCAVQLATLIG
jgi:hypothetical protein